MRNIGNYDSCSYNLKGEGTFRAKEGTHPFCGTIGELHHENEVRIETILPVYKKAEVIKALLSVHPYEEPAFDLYPLQNDWLQAGSGIVGELDESETELEFLKRIKKIFEVGCVRHNKLTGERNTEGCLVWWCRSFPASTGNSDGGGCLYYGRNQIS